MEETKLTGTEKQIAWAEKIRAEKLENIKLWLENDADGKGVVTEHTEGFEELKKETVAAAWIELRNEGIDTVLQQYYWIGRSRRNETPFVPIETGTEKQIAYAHVCRGQAMAEFNRVEKKLNYRLELAEFCLNNPFNYFRNYYPQWTDQQKEEFIAAEKKWLTDIPIMRQKTENGKKQFLEKTDAGEIIDRAGKISVLCAHILGRL